MVCAASTSFDRATGGERIEQAADFQNAMRFDRRETLAAALGDREVASPAVGLGGLPADQPVRFEVAQDAAEVAGIESQIAGDFGRGRPVALTDFVEHARLRQRKRAADPAFAQDADALRVEPVEAPQRRDVILDPVHGNQPR